jgi:hypothetical protein
MKKFAAALLAAGLTSACSTTSFAPPVVNLEHRLAADSTRVCRPTDKKVAIDKPSVDNARSLIENFILVYRCRSREAANGRQTFQLPGFVASVGAAAASAFGGGSDWGIAGMLGSSVANAGNSYYAPQRQAEIFDSAIDALVCIKTEAVGVEALTIEKVASESGGEEGGVAGDEGGAAVHTSPAAQYYDLVRASLYSVERVTAARLRNVGTFDPAGVVAELTALNKQVDEPPTAKPEGKPGANEVGGDESGGGADEDDLETVRIEILKLKPKLERCVVRAKI